MPKPPHHPPPHGRPPHHGPAGPSHRHRHALSSLGAAATPQALERALSLVVPDADDAAFVARCILSEGPAHHRAASWALVCIAAEVARRVGAEPAPGGEAVVPVALRLPPHERTEDDDVFPLGVPLDPVRAVLEREHDVEAVADALADGPPHHALANAAVVAILGRVLAKIGDGRP